MAIAESRAHASRSCPSKLVPWGRRRLGAMTPHHKVWLTAAVLAMAAVALVGGIASHGPVIDVGAQWWLFAVAFAAAERVVAHVEIRQQAHTLSLSEAVMLLGLMLLGPLGFVVGCALGAGAAMALRRLSVQKFVFNVSLVACEAALATWLLRAVFRVHAEGPFAWAAAGASVLVAVMLGAAAVAWVISLFDTTRPKGLLRGVIEAQGLTATASISLAVVGAAATAYSVASLGYLAVLLIGVLVLLRQQAAAAQRASSLQHVSHFTATLVGLASTTEVAETSLREAAQVMRGARAAIVGVEGGVEQARTYWLESDEVVLASPPAFVESLVAVEEPQLLRDVTTANGHPGLPDGVVAPLSIGGTRALFVVWDRSTEVGEFSPSGLTLFGALVTQTQVAFDRSVLIDKLDHDAHHDGLTSLPNRLGFSRAVELPDGATGALLVIDLNRFKDINDTLGHPTGDRALGIIADRLRGVVDDGAVLARLGGDEFAVFDSSAGDAEVASALAGELIESIEAPIAFEDLSLQIGASVGIALAPTHGHDLTALMRHADIAMYEAKRVQSGWQFYRHEDDTNDPRRLELVSSLRRAIDGRELEVWYQPKLRLCDRIVVGAEALARWHHPRYGFVPPDEFIAVAEGAGLMRKLTDAVLDRVVSEISRWQAQGIDLQVAVNLSTRNLLDDSLADRVAELLRVAGPLPSCHEPADDGDTAGRVAAVLPALGGGLRLDR